MWEYTPVVEILVSYEHHHQGGDVEDSLYYPLANALALLLTKLEAFLAFIIRSSILLCVQLAQFVVLNSAILTLVPSSSFLVTIIVSVVFRLCFHLSPLLSVERRRDSLTPM